MTLEQRRIFSRYCLEESARRRQKRDAQPLSKNQILKILLPDYEARVTNYKTAYKAHIDKSLEGSSDGDKYAAYRVVADRLRAEAQALAAANQEEVKREDDEEEAKQDPAEQNGAS